MNRRLADEHPVNWINHIGEGTQEREDQISSPKELTAFFWSLEKAEAAIEKEKAEIQKKKTGAGSGVASEEKAEEKTRLENIFDVLQLRVRGAGTTSLESVTKLALHILGAALIADPAKLCSIRINFFYRICRLQYADPAYGTELVDKSIKTKGY